jgi:hypothetical protein
MRMNIEAVTVCVGYGDFLAAVVPWNAPHFNRWIIVTEEQDAETRDVCRRHGLQCLLSHDHKRDGAVFNKGRLVERALQHTSEDCWRLHIDADVVLPARFRQLADAAHLRAESIYGVDRINVRSWEKWQELLRSGWLQATDGRGPHTCPFPEGFPVGARWMHPEAGYVPIGFFQLWHWLADEHRGVRQRPYPITHGSAARSDVKHGLQWDRQLRALIPEIVVAHLESEPCQVGANWKGRTTKRFGPPRHGARGRMIS